MTGEKLIVVGRGAIADALRPRLDAARMSWRAVDDCTPPTGIGPLHLVVDDDWRPARLSRWIASPARWLGAHVILGRGLVGPFAEPGADGCVECAVERLLAPLPDASTLRSVRERLRNEGSALPGLGDIGMAGALATLLAAEAERALAGHSPRTRGHVFVRHADGSGGLFPLIADARCPACDRRLDDEAAAVRIELRPLPKADPSSYRLRDAGALQARLVARWLGSPLSPLREPRIAVEDPFAVASVELPLRLGFTEVGIGRSSSFDRSRATAVLEALERLAGWTHGARRTVVRGSWDELRADAVDPLSFGVHADESYRRAGFAFIPFDPHAPLRWVWAWSFARGRALLVPETYAYYGSVGDPAADRRFVYEISNGCALGACVEEALLYGLFELIERDAFLMTWYARLGLTELATTSVRDTIARQMIARLEAGGRRVRLFDATLDSTIPSLLAVVIGAAADGPRVCIAAGAHLDPLRALKSALHEVGGTVVNSEANYRAFRPHALRMLEDPFAVTKMEHHAQLGCLPEAFARFDFLLAQERAAVPMGERFAGAVPPSPDLSDDVRAAVGRVLDLGLDVLVVDQTPRELAADELRCVKVIVPGLLPMTFGHAQRRLENLPRLRRVPAALGLPSPLAGGGQPNPHPHPFP